MYILFLSFLITHLASTAMESIDCKIMITAKTPQPIRYAIQEYHTKAFAKTSLKSNIQDPLVFCEIIGLLPEPIFPVPLPIKELVNRTDGSVLQIQFTKDWISPSWGKPDQRKTFKAPFILNATFINNADLKGNSFNKQLCEVLKNFDKHPVVVDPDGTQELEAADIITSRMGILHNKKTRIFSHGPKSFIRNEKALVKSIINKENNKGFFALIKDREHKGSFK